MSILDGIIALVLGGTLLENRAPVIPAAGSVILILRGLASRIRQGLGFKSFFGFKKLEWAIVAYLTYWLLNYAWSGGDVPNLMSFEFLRRDGALLVTYPVFLFLLAWSLKPRQCRAFWIGFISILSLIAMAGVTVSLSLPHPYFFDDLRLVGYDISLRQNVFFGWYEAHNTAGGVYALASIIALAFLLEQRPGGFRKLFLWSVMLACIAALAFTYSRGAYLAFLAGAAVILPLRQLRRSIKIGLILGVPALLIVLMTSPLVSRVDTITDPYYGTNADRFRIWGEALEDFSLSPLVGIGFGRFNDEALQFAGTKQLVWVAVRGRIVNNDSHAHNSYLHFMAEGGIAGLFITLYVWWCVWSELSFFGRQLDKSRVQEPIRAGKGCLIGVLVMSATEHMLGKGSVVLVLMALAAMTLATARLEWGRIKRPAKALSRSAESPFELQHVAPRAE